MYTIDSRVRYSEVDVKRRLTLEALMNYYQDCSTFQSEDCGAGLDYMYDRNIAWVVSSWQVITYRYPLLGEKIYVSTMPYGMKGFVGFRDFKIESESGELLSCANSVWALINIKTGLPERISDELLGKFVLEEKLDVEFPARKISFPKDGETFDAPEIVVVKSQLDTNRHVNNEQYIAMARDSISEEGSLTPVRRLRAEYKQQARLGNTIYPFVNKRNIDGMDVCTVSLNDSDKKPYAVIEFELAK